MQPFQRTLARLQDDASMFFDTIVIGPVTVSIQGSSTHYSQPRRLTEASEYSRMEVALWWNTGPFSDEWFRPDRFPRYACKAWAQFWGDDVAAYMPVEQIQAMLDTIRANPPPASGLLLFVRRGQNGVRAVVRPAAVSSHRTRHRRTNRRWERKDAREKAKKARNQPFSVAWVAYC